MYIYIFSIMETSFRWQPLYTNEGRKIVSQQAGFAEPHSSSTIGWVVVGVVVVVGLGLGSG